MSTTLKSNKFRNIIDELRSILLEEKYPSPKVESLIKSLGECDQRTQCVIARISKFFYDNHSSNGLTPIDLQEKLKTDVPLQRGAEKNFENIIEDWIENII